MWDSLSSVSSFKLVSDQQNLKTESFASKFLKKVKMQAAPFFSSSNNFLQTRYPPTLFGFCDLFNVPGTTTISDKELDLKMSIVKMDDVPVTQNFSQLPVKVPKVPPIISGFIGTKSYCPRKESFLDPLVMNLLNCKLSEKMPTKSESSTCKSIADEVKKYFNQEKPNLDVKKPASVTTSINSKGKMNKNASQDDAFVGMKMTTIVTKPICTVLPIVKVKESSESFHHLPMAGSDKMTGNGEKTDEILEEISLTMLIQSISTGNESAVDNPGRVSQLCLNCQAKLKPLNCRKLKKLKVQERKLSNCLCPDKPNNDAIQNEKKAKSSKSRKTRKSQQKRKNKLKQCREQQMIGIVDNDSIPVSKKIIGEANTDVHDQVDSTNVLGFDKNMERSLPSPIMDDLEFDIVFDYETELCGVHSLSHSSDSQDYDCDNSNISFILNGNDDLYDSDSDCGSEVNGEFDDYSWQCFKKQFAEFQEVDRCTSLEETRFDVNFDNDGFEILISGNVCDTVDFAAQAMAENLSKVNKKWDEDTKDCHPPECKTSKVSFAPEEKLVQIRKILVVCEDERKSNWEQLSLDRSRFQKRIVNVEPLLSIILTKEHREEIYNARFGDMQN